MPEEIIELVVETQEPNPRVHFRTGADSLTEAITRAFALLRIYFERGDRTLRVRVMHTVNRERRLALVLEARQP